MITAATTLYCVMGSPVSHSKGPIVHNAAFAAHRVDAVYLAFEPPHAKAAVQAVKALGIRGASITIPFKEEIIPLLDAIHPDAAAIGAVNTLVLEEGRLTGYNTDWQAAVAPLLDHGIDGKTVCIVGAGGAARAVAHGIRQNGGDLIITNRGRERGEQLAAHVNGNFIPLAEADAIRADVVINTTCLGMEPKIQTLSFPKEALEPGMVVMDVVYTPIETALIKAAKARNCTAIDGLSMFIAQAAAQFELWTGIRPDTLAMKASILNDSGVIS